MAKRNTTKIAFYFQQVERQMSSPPAAIVYNWEQKIIKVGGSTKYEIALKDIIKGFFGKIELNHRGSRFTSGYDNTVGRIRKRKKGKISFYGKCPNYRFKIGYRKLCEARNSGGIVFSEVQSIGRAFN